MQYRHKEILTINSIKYGTETVQVTPLRRTLASSP